MARWVPQMVFHRPSGRWRVRIRGRDRYLSKDKAEAEVQYRQIIGSYLTHGIGHAPTVNELVARFLANAEREYAPSVTAPWNSEATNHRCALRPLRQLYGDLPATEFGPKKLKEVRDRMVALGWRRESINRKVNRIRTMFRWAVEEELIAASVWHGLLSLRPLRRGLANVTPSRSVEPVCDEDLGKLREHMTPQMWHMVSVLRTTGMRAGELVQMRCGDIDRSRDPWLYVPAHHKSEHRNGRDRRIYLRPSARRIIELYLTDDPAAPVFRSPSTRDHYGVSAIRRALERASRRAGVDHVFPHQLRHAAGTEARELLGLEAAQAVLGHERIETTQVYAHRQDAKARQVSQTLD